MHTEVQVYPSKQFLFVWWEGGGNMPPALEIIRQLVNRKHRVHVLGDPCSQHAFRDAGATFSPFTRAPRRIDRNPANDPIRDWEAKNPLAAMRNLRDRLMFGPALRYAEDTLEQIDRVRPDAIGVMDLTFGPLIAAEKARVPVALIAPHILAYPVAGRPPFGPGLLPARTALEKLREYAVRRVATGVFSKGLSALNDARMRLGLDPLRGAFDQVKRADRILVLTSEAIELPGGPLPPNVRYTGPVLVDPVWSGEYEVTRTTNEPLVLVSFSTTFQNQTSTLQSAISALGTLRVRGTVTTGPSLSARDVNAAGNVSVIEAAPHNAILPHAAAMITHCGHGSVIRALSHGVPLVCVPMGRDQNDIAARVVYHGAGIRLSRGASPAEFRAAVERVIGEPQYRAAAARLASAIRRDAENSTTIAELEGLAGVRTGSRARGVTVMA